MVATARNRASISAFDDQMAAASVRKLVLKLRWIGMGGEAAVLGAATIDPNPAQRMARGVRLQAAPDLADAAPEPSSEE